MTETKKLEGVIVPLITPCLNGEFDEESFLKIADYVLRAGVQGLFILGTTGEFEYLSIEQKKRVIEVTAEKYKGKANLLAGTTCDKLEDTIELTRHAKEEGIDAAVLAPEYQFEKRAFGYVQEILDKTRVPVVLYNNPEISYGRMLNFEAVEELSFNPSVIGIKDSSSDMDYFLQLLSLRSESFSVLQGSESRLQESLESGIDGCVSGSANFAPELAMKIYKEKKKEYFDALKMVNNGARRYGNYIQYIKHIVYTYDLTKSEELFDSSQQNEQTLIVPKLIITSKNV